MTTQSASLAATHEALNILSNVHQSLSTTRGLRLPFSL